MYIEIVNEYKPIKKFRRRMNRYDKLRKPTLVRRKGKNGWYVRQQWHKDKLL